MPGWPSKLFPNSSSSHTPFVSRRAPSPDSDEEPLPRPPLPTARIDPYGNYGSSPPKPSSNSPRAKPHMHTSSDKMFSTGKKKKGSGPELESKSYPSATDSYFFEGPSSVAKTGKSKADDKDMEVGNCATCDSKVKWPKGVNEFRCSTCLMVNDLKPAQLRSRSPRDPGVQPPGPSGTQPASHSVSRPLPLTVERTIAIIDRCIDTYFEAYRQGNVPSRSPVTRTPPDSPMRSPLSPGQISPASPRPIGPAGDRMKQLPGTPPEDSLAPQAFPFGTMPSPGRPRPSSRERRPSCTPESHHVKGPEVPQITRKPVGTSGISIPARPTRKPPPAPVGIGESSVTRGPLVSDTRGINSRDGPHHDMSNGRPPPILPPSRIFKPVEDYITRSYGDQECLNTAFLTSKSRPRVISRGDETRRLRPDQSPPKSNPSHPGTDTAISEIDAKTLLLGDVAANGLWWTGIDDRPSGMARRRKSDRGPDNVRPLVNLKSPHINWFELDTWYHTIRKAGVNWRDRLKDADKQRFELETINSDIAQGRAHLQQALLKCTETLLKRPGRPLKEPQDSRFLLILLANPLIYPPLTSSSVNTPPQTVPSAWDSGNAYGIIKRLLGIISNLSGECHRHFTSWFSRYDETRFRSIVDIIERFVTHRLKRSHGRKKSSHVNPIAGLIPSLSGTNADTSAQLHAALGLGNPGKPSPDKFDMHTSYSEDWQVRAAARVMSLLFTANKSFNGERSATTLAEDARMSRPGSISRTHIKIRGQLLSTSDFYNTMVDISDLIADFDVWESSKGNKFAFCQYPFFLSVGAKIRIMEHDAKRQMEVRAREAFFDSLLKNKALDQYIILKVRRDCLVEDSLNGISEVVNTGSQEDIKKSLKVQFVNEEGVDAGGLRKEWFLLLAREIFDPNHGLFLYDEESKFCWFNPNSFETSDRFYLVGALIGLAIYHTTIIDVPLPPFTFKKLLSASPPPTKLKVPVQRLPLYSTLDDLAELRPSLARGLRQLLDFEGDVQETFCRDFVAEFSSYDSISEVPLCEGGSKRPVTNSNRAEFVDLYVRYLLDTQVARQFEPFKRGFFTVCGGNALSLFQPEEIELLVRGSDEGLDVSSLRGVAAYQNWKNSGKPISNPDDEIALIRWFWELLEEADAQDQRKLLSFITGSDRIPAVGATSLVITISYAGPDAARYPIARTCFNMILLFQYRSKQDLHHKLWSAMTMSEGFGLR